MKHYPGLSIALLVGAAACARHAPKSRPADAMPAPASKPASKPAATPRTPAAPAAEPAAATATATTAAATPGAKVVRANNAFAAELYAHECARPGNLFMSPASVSTTLAMTSAGAAGDTLKQIAGVLHFGNAPQAHTAYAALLRALTAAGNTKMKLHIANRLWGQSGMAFRQQFLATLRREYGAGLGSVDFHAHADQARRTINEWVAGKTHGKIRDLLKPNTIKPVTRLVLTDTVYFKGTWKTPFEAATPRSGNFVVAPGHSVHARMMNESVMVRYGETKKARIVELPYASSDPARALAMVIVLPKRKNGLRAIEARLSVARIDKWIGALARKKYVHVTLPRFKTSSDLMLGAVLSKMGMPLAFSDKADFSGMAASGALQLSKVVHDASVVVNENGTEATAATGAVMSPRGSVRGGTKFRADHPFLYLIRQPKSGAILFIGRLVDPTAS